MEDKANKVGRPKTLNDGTRLTITLDSNLRTKLEKMAEDQDRSLSYIVSKLIKEA